MPPNETRAVRSSIQPWPPPFLQHRFLVFMLGECQTFKKPTSYKKDAQWSQNNINDILSADAPASHTVTTAATNGVTKMSGNQGIGVDAGSRAVIAVSFEILHLIERVVQTLSSQIAATRTWYPILSQNFSSSFWTRFLN